MNEEIKAILEKHRIQTNERLLGVSDLFKALIEICELQKEECASNPRLLEETKDYILNSKNVAE